MFKVLLKCLSFYKIRSSQSAGYEFPYGVELPGTNRDSSDGRGLVGRVYGRRVGSITHPRDYVSSRGPAATSLSISEGKVSESG